MKTYITVLLCLLMLGCAATQTQVAEPEKYNFREGTNYRRIEPSMPTESKPGRVEVLEMFFYGCPHCYELEPKLEAWVKKQKNVDFRKIPAIIGPSWAEHAKFYFTAQKLGVLDELHKKFFDDIHINGKQNFSELSLRQFFTSNGVNVGDYENAYLSKDVLEKINYARKISVMHNMRGVPYVVVNGKYITAPFLVSSQEEMLKVLDFLVASESAE